MIRVYLDWNIISYLKEPKNSHILDFIKSHKEHFLFLYSPAHFQDLMKSNQEHPNFQKDLETLEWLCGKHHIRWENDHFSGLFGYPSEYFDKIKDSPKININDFDIEKQFETLKDLTDDNPFLNELIDIYKKTLQNYNVDLNLDENTLIALKIILPEVQSKGSLWDFVKAFGINSFEMLQQKEIWLNIRKHIQDAGGSLDINAGNWSKEDVIHNVDSFIKKISSSPISFFDYIQVAYKGREKPPTLYELYRSAYLTLDLLGYKSDTLPKSTNGFQNITTDVDHSFLAQTCDIFVLEDKKMKAKTEALYYYFSINSKVIGLGDFVVSCSKMLHDQSHNSLLEVIQYLFKTFENDINHLLLEEQNSFYKCLNRKFLNIFDFVHFEHSKDDGILCMTFSKDESKPENFIYFTEKEYYIDQIERLFDWSEVENGDYNEWRQNFIHKHVFDNKQYQKDGINGLLWQHEKYYYPLLSFFVKII